MTWLPVRQSSESAMAGLLLLMVVAVILRHTHQATPECADADRDLGAIRLNGTQYALRGRVEVCGWSAMNVLQWGRVCSDNWNDRDAEVVCRQLGFSSQGAIANSHPRTSPLPYILNNAKCFGDETRLLDCPIDVSGIVICSSSEEAAVRCQSAQCGDWDIRLVDGDSNWSGRVEVCINGQWGTVQDTDWSAEDAYVVCRQLGYTPADPGGILTVTAVLGGFFGRGTGPIHLNSVQCYRTENALVECILEEQAAIFDHRRDAGIRCALEDTAATSNPTESWTLTDYYNPTNDADITQALHSDNTTQMTGTNKGTSSLAVVVLGIICGILTTSLVIVLPICLGLLIVHHRHKNTSQSPTSIFPGKTSNGGLENPTYPLQSVTNEQRDKCQPLPESARLYEAPLSSAPTEEAELYETVPSAQHSDEETELYATAYRGEPQPYEIPLSRAQ